jgi:cytochrome c oxidase assembly protein subunit 15
MDSASSSAPKRFQIFASALLVYNIPVILWGAYVRISFSGNGCGANWPFCNGQAIPQHMGGRTLIEFTHRMMTSLDLIGVITLCAWAFLLFPRKHPVRRYAALSLLFLFVEALLGAGLVLLRLVEKDQSAGRAWYLSAHLTNTLLLLASLTVTAWLPTARISRVSWRNAPRTVLAALGVAVLVSVTGAIAALGDTLFPASSLAVGMQQDFSAASSLLLRLRLFHPAIAVTGAAYLVFAALQVLRRNTAENVRTAGGRVITITIFQLAAGAINLTFLAPVWMQLFHLLMADILWISLIVLAIESVAAVAGEPNLGRLGAQAHSRMQSAGASGL